MRDKTPNILIVGAGPTGLTAALELARRGIMPTIIDKKDKPSPLSRAVGILPASMEIFQPSGVAEKIRRNAIEAREIRVHNGHHLKAALPLNIHPDPNMRILALPQDETETIIRETFETMGGKVLYGSQLEQLRQNKSCVHATVNGVKNTFDYVIGADGIRSRTRKAIGINFNGYDLEDEWSIADFETTQNYGADCFNIFFLPHGKAVLLIPLSHNKKLYRYRAVSSTRDALEALPFKLHNPKINRAASFIIKIAQVEHYQKERVYLAGDAAHCHSPVGGRGMNLGIADAAFLAKLFAEGGLENYHANRHVEGRRVIKNTEAARKFLMSESWWKRRLFISVIKTASMFPILHRVLLRNMLTG